MNHIHTLKLHQLRLGELPAAEAEAARAHLEGCALCASRLRHQVHTREAFELRPMPEALRPRPSWLDRLRSAWKPAAALVPVLLVGLFVLRAGPPPAVVTDPVMKTTDHTVPASPEAMPNVVSSEAVTPPQASPVITARPSPPHPAVTPPPAPTAPSPEPEDAVRAKGGGGHLEAWVQAGESARPLYVGESVGVGTRLQLRYDPQGRRFVTLAGRDSDGVVEVYGTVPGGDRGVVSTAPFALTLDDSRGEQAFFAVCTDSRPTPEAVMAAIRHNPVRMEGALVASVVVRKD